MEILETNKLCKTFSTGGVQQHVICNLDVTIYKGDFTVIMGSSGSGKTTLLYALSGMDTPTLGEVWFGSSENKINIAKMKNDELALFRRKHCGFVFQSIYLQDNMDVLDNVLTSGLLVNKHKREVIDKSKQLLKRVGLIDNDLLKFPSQLSGGEKQRVALVRSLINNPEIVFADEPTGALNSASSNQVLDILTEVNKEGQSIVLVTHDLKTALRGNRILYVKDGIISGELILGYYDDKNSESRRKILKEFLEKMGW